MTEVKLLGKRVLIKEIKEEESKSKGIILVEKTQKSQKLGTIVKAGSKTEDVQVGDRVIFERYHAKEIVVEEEEYLMMDYESVIAVLS